MAKFYIVRAVHKATFKTIYKFGWTKSKDVLERFNHTYIERRKYVDFNFSVVFSMYYYTPEEATAIEDLFKTRYPEIPNVNEYFGKEPGYYHSNNLTGISEMRIWDDETFSKIRESMYEFKRNR